MTNRFSSLFVAFSRVALVWMHPNVANLLFRAFFPAKSQFKIATQIADLEARNKETNQNHICLAYLD